MFFPNVFSGLRVFYSTYLGWKFHTLLEFFCNQGKQRKMMPKQISSSVTMNVLGVTFDSTLNWQKHVETAIKKSQKALQAIKLIRPIMTKAELLTIVKSNFFSILYYNAIIWLIPSLKLQVKNQLLSVSASPLKLCCYGYDQNVSYKKLHDIVKYPTPEQIKLFVQFHSK